MKTKEVDSESKNGAIAAAIGITLFCTLIFTTIFHNTVEFTQHNSFTMHLLFIGIYIIVHPIIGKIIYEIFSVLCRGINVVYNLQGSSRWGVESNAALIFASAWPLSGPIGITVTLIGVILGFLFKKLFH